MSSIITITVTNRSAETRDFFFFQQPAAYAGRTDVSVNSLQTAPIVPQSQGGSAYRFHIDLDCQAGVQRARGAPVVGQVSGYAPALQPRNRPAGQQELLRIVSPRFDPEQHVINAGCAVRVDGGGAVLSNFVQTEPNEVLDCRPAPVFYVAIGRYPTGTVIDLGSAMADPALCDGTQGEDNFHVVFEADGTWTVTAGLARGKRKLEGRARAAVEATILNATIKNNAGTKLVCQGRAVTTSIPVIIENLSAPRSLLVHSEYLVSLNNGPFRGFILTDLSETGQAVFD